MAASTEEMKKHIRIYMIVFASLAILTIATVAVAYLDLAIVPALLVALLIATVKGSLVAGYFMHLVSEKRVIFVFLILTGVFLAGMFFLVTFSHYDQIGDRFVP